MNSVKTTVKLRIYDEESLPKPVGWRILVEPITIERITPGGLVLPDSNIEAQEHNRYVGRVVAMGDACYKHPIFQEVGGKPWCHVGDWIIYNQYTGMGAKIKDSNGEVVHMRFINDKAVLATTKNPESFEIGI